VETTWAPIDEGATLGTSGSESGTIVLDDEHPAGARITIERATPTAPFAITCGIYGLMAHTRFFGSESEARAECDAMKRAIEGMLALMADEAQSDEAMFAALRKFIAEFP
jgi:hypothetical protein